MRKIIRQPPIDQILQTEGNCRIRLNSQHLLHELLRMTNDKCAYCETHYDHSLQDGRPEHIEHFYPRNTYPELSNHWWNLFPSCPSCNLTKGDGFEIIDNNKRIIPLKPDDDGRLFGKPYQFEKWFLINFETGEIRPNNHNEKWKRAERSIELFNLNRFSLMKARKDLLKNYINDYNRINNFRDNRLRLQTKSYSFYIEYWLKFKKLDYQY